MCLINFLSVDNSPTKQTILLFFTNSVMDFLLELVTNLPNNQIVELIFWLYTNILGDIKQNKATVRNLYLCTNIHKKNIERCLDTSIRLEDKFHSLNIIYKCLENGGEGKWCFNLIEVYAVNLKLVNYQTNGCEEASKMILGLSRISDLDSSENHKQMVKLKIHNIIINHMIKWDSETINNAIRILNNICYKRKELDTKECTINKELINLGLVRSLETIIKRFKGNQVIFAPHFLLCLIANISTDNDLEIKKTILKSSLFNFINLNTEANSLAKTQAICALANLISQIDIKLAKKFVKNGGMLALINIINYEESPEFIQLAIRLIKKILEVEDPNVDDFKINIIIDRFRVKFFLIDGVEAFKKLLSHSDKDAIEK